MIRLFRILASLRLTLVLLSLSLVLVFLGTLAQEPLGLYFAQGRFFHSAFVDLASMVAALKKALQMATIYLPPSTAADVLHAPFIPAYPGGYLLGFLLLINLLAAHAVRFKFTWKKSGILLVHLGVILLLLGQLFTDVLARESAMRLSEGQTMNYSESDRRTELAIIDVSAPDRDRVVAIPDSLLVPGAALTHPEIPFRINVLKFYPNSTISTNRSEARDYPNVTEGPGARFFAVDQPRVTVMDMRDVPSAVVEIQGNGGSLGTFLLSEYFARPQVIRHEGKTYELGLRLRRYYQDFSLTLLDFRHDLYKGTAIPKNFSSQVRLRNPKTGENREVLIRMNEPLRYQGRTFYQASFDKLDERVTILQVVRNPAWLTPYFACLIVGGGLLVQFTIHLLAFVRKRLPASTSRPA